MSNKQGCDFELKDGLTQGHWYAFRKAQWVRGKAYLDDFGVDAVTQLPSDIFYQLLVESAIEADWIETDLEPDDIANLPMASSQISEWGAAIWGRAIDSMAIDPN